MKRYLNVFFCVCSKVDGTPIIILTLLDPEFERGWLEALWVKSESIRNIWKLWWFKCFHTLLRERIEAVSKLKSKHVLRRIYFFILFPKKNIFYLKKKYFFSWNDIRELSGIFKELFFFNINDSKLNYYGQMSLIFIASLKWYFFMFTRNKSLIVEETAHV